MKHIIYLTEIRVEIPIGFKTSLQFCSGSKEFQKPSSNFTYMLGVGHKIQSISQTWVLDITYKCCVVVKHVHDEFMGVGH
jgi:hypothetical protein